MLWVPGLNTRVRWYQVLPQLGVDVPDLAPPFSVTCPLCHGARLTIYKDTRFDGNWHYCYDCKSYGDMVWLAAQYWKTDSITATKRLIEVGDPNKGSQKDIRDVMLRQQRYARDVRIEEYLKVAANNIVAGHPAGAILRHFGIHSDLQPSVWLRRMGRFIGVSERSEAQDACLKAPESGVAVQYIFDKRPRPKELCVIPFCDMPGRISGLLFISHDEAGEIVTFFLSLLVKTTGDNERIESGLAMQPVLLGPTAGADVFGNTVFVMDNALLAIKLQHRHMRDNDTPLPLVATYGGKMSSTQTRKLLSRGVAHNVWEHYPDREFAFWSPVLSPHIVSAAARAGGRLLFASRDSMMKNMSSQGWFEHVHRAAKPWTVALCDALTAQSDEALARLIPQFDMPRIAFQRFVEKCPAELQQRIYRSIPACRDTACVNVGGQRFQEANSRLYAAETGTCILTASLRIDKAINSTLHDKLYYGGRVIFEDTEIPFIEPADEMDAHAPKIIRKYVTGRQLGLVEYDPKYATYITHIAQRIRRPECITVSGQFGWDSHADKLVMPNFTLSATGQLDTTTMPHDGQFVPGLNLCAPKPTAPLINALLQEGVANSYFWAVAASVATNVIGYARGWQPALTCLVGPTMDVAGLVLAEALGCAILRHPRKPMPLEALRNAADAHRWPLYVHADRLDPALRTWLCTRMEKNAMLATSADAADVATLYSTVRILDAGTPIVASDALLYGALVLPHWLHDLALRRFAIDARKGPVFAVLEDMASWAQNFGDASIVRQAKAHIIDAAADATVRASRLFAFVHRAVATGKMRLGQEGYDPYLADSAYRLTDAVHGVFLAQHTLNLQLSAMYMPAVSPTDITKLLQQGGALAREYEYNGQQGWLLSERWWNQGFNLCHNGRAELKVVG